MERTGIIRVSYRVLDYARAAFREQVQSLLSDPSDLLNPWREGEPAEVIAALRSLGQELGLDYDTLVLGGHDYQRERLAAIEAGTIQPAPREPIPDCGG
jgi:hypothetical protein